MFFFILYFLVLQLIKGSNHTHACNIIALSNILLDKILEKEYLDANVAALPAAFVQQTIR